MSWPIFKIYVSHWVHLGPRACTYMYLGLGHLRGLIPGEDQFFLSRTNQWLPKALHLGVGPCEISPSILAYQVVILLPRSCEGGYSVEISQLPVMFGRHYLEAGNLVLWIFPLPPSTTLPELLGCRGFTVNVASWFRNTTATYSLHFDQLNHCSIVSICCKKRLLWWGVRAVTTVYIGINV